MGYFTFPVEGVKYRIRNVDYRDYLEQRPLDDNVVLRSEARDGDPLQHWTFSWVNSKNHTVKIYDADGDSTLYVQSTPNNSTPNTNNLNIKYGTPTANDEDIWKLITDPLKDGKT